MSCANTEWAAKRAAGLYPSGTTRVPDKQSTTSDKQNQANTEWAAKRAADLYPSGTTATKSLPKRTPRPLSEQEKQVNAAIREQIRQSSARQKEEFRVARMSPTEKEADDRRNVQVAARGWTAVYFEECNLRAKLSYSEPCFSQEVIREAEARHKTGIVKR
jgi:hypothetical protein